MHFQLGILGVTGFLMQDTQANHSITWKAENGKNAAMKSQWLGPTNPDLSAFYKRGGKMIVAIGTNDTLASPALSTGLFQSVLDKMGRDRVDTFARFFVLPTDRSRHLGHQLHHDWRWQTDSGAHSQPI